MDDILHAPRDEDAQQAGLPLAKRLERYRAAWMDGMARVRLGARRFQHKLDEATAGGKRLFTPLNFLAVAAVVGVTYLAGISTLLPPNRGDLTVAEFAENYNYYRDHFEIDPRFSLDRDGKWEKAEDAGYVVISIGGELPQPDYVFTTEDGMVTQVSWSYTLEEAVHLDSVSPQLCYLSLAAAQRGTHVWDLKNDGLLMEGWDVNAEHFSCSWQGVTLDYRTQLLRDADGWHLRPGSTVSCTVTVEH